SVAGVPRHVERKTFDLLLYLVERRGRVVTKEELNLAVWGGCSVSDGALTQCVWTCRRAIGDARPRGALIQTHNGVGYRFAGEVAVRSTTVVAPAARGSFASGGYDLAD